MTGGVPAVEARGLTIVYRGRRQTVACWEIDLTVAPGEFLCLLGPSGCGKSTFLHALGGLVPVTRGELRVSGRRATVFQSPSLLPWRTVLRNVTYGLELAGVRAPEAARRAAPLVDLVGLGGFTEYFTGELSGGMQQRVNLARALAVDPDVLLLDEPFAALDAQTRELMQVELLRIWRESRKTSLFVTHDIHEAVYLGDRVAVFTARPARIKEIVPVDLPRPRELAVKRSPEFLRLVDRLWSLIELPGGMDE